MPPKSRKTDPDTDTGDEPALSQGDPGDLCTEGCFPDGWGESDQAMCVHGTWTRE